MQIVKSITPCLRFATSAMFGMQKLDIAALQRAFEGA
jgi:hypothetical protein